MTRGGDHRRGPARWMLAAVVAVAAMAGPVTTASADHQGNHGTPLGPAVARFPAGFPELVDNEWGFALGGFGGALDDDADWGVEPDPSAPDRPNVIMIHGNVVDHADWYPVRDAFIAAGWSPDDLWALSYNGIGSQNGSDGTGNPRRDAEHTAYPGYDYGARTTNNDVNVPDVKAFVDAVRSFTREQEYVLIGHSLGVTLARKTLAVHPELRTGLRAFIGLAGANHGTSLCPPGSEGIVMSCDEIAAGTEWLADLNGAAGELETFEGPRWLTVYDGTGAMDVAFLGSYADSPVLEGAENLAIADNHNDLRIAPASIEAYRTWLEEVLAAPSVQATVSRGPDPADRAGSPPVDVVPSAATSLPATGGAGLAGASLLVVGAVLVLRRRTRVDEFTER